MESINWIYIYIIFVVCFFILIYGLNKFVYKRAVSKYTVFPFILICAICYIALKPSPNTSSKIFYFASSNAQTFQNNNENYVALVVSKLNLLPRKYKTGGTFTPSEVRITYYLDVYNLNSGKSAYKVSLPQNSADVNVQSIDKNNIILKYYWVKHNGIFNIDYSKDTYDVTTLIIDKASGKIINKSVVNTQKVNYINTPQRNILSDDKSKINFSEKKYVESSKYNNKIVLKYNGWNTTTNFNTLNTAYLVSPDYALLMGSDLDDRPSDNSKAYPLFDYKFINSNFDSETESYNISYINLKTGRLKEITLGKSGV